jgi:RNA polymerase sigma-70 factor (ECF subfamily)
MAGLGFKTTHWTLIVRAQGSEQEKRAAIDEIAANYRQPLVRYARARGLSTDAAEDLVQSLFVTLLAKDFVARLDPERGRLRGFLKRALDHELLHAIERDRAKRRGGGTTPESIDFLEAADKPSGGTRPDQIYEREWALAVAARALKTLSAEARSSALKDRWPVVERFLSEDTPMSYADAAQLARITVAQFKVTLHRARRRFEELLRAEVGVTVDDDTEVESEEQSVKRELEA